MTFWGQQRKRRSFRRFPMGNGIPGRQLHLGLSTHHSHKPSSQNRRSGWGQSCPTRRQPFRRCTLGEPGRKGQISPKSRDYLEKRLLGREVTGRIGRKCCKIPPSYSFLRFPPGQIMLEESRRKTQFTTLSSCQNVVCVGMILANWQLKWLLGTFHAHCIILAWDVSLLQSKLC